MPIQTLLTPPTMRPTLKSPSPPPDPPEENPGHGDRVELSYALGALNGAAVLAPPMVAGITFGLGGALAGGVLAFVIHSALEQDPKAAARSAFWGTALGLLAVGRVPPSLMGLGLAVGVGALVGVAAVAERRE